MNEWLVAAFVLVAALAPCCVVCVRGTLSEALVALELAGLLATLAFLMVAEGIQREPLVDLAVTLGVMSFLGDLAFTRFLEREIGWKEARGG